METDVSHYPDPKIEGCLAYEELDWLFQKAKEMRNVVEIGSWMGKSSHALLSGCPGTVYCVDHFLGSPTERDKVHKRALTENIHALFIQNVGHFKNLTLLKMDSLIASTQFSDKSIDMIFIDGDHEEDQFRADFEAWYPKTKKLLCGHDLYDDRINKVIREIDLPYRIHNETWTIWSIYL